LKLQHKYLLFVLLMNFSLLFAFGQDQKKIDSLKLIIARTQNDTVKLKTLVVLNQINQNRKELTEGFKQQIELSKSLKEYSEACVGYSKLGYFEFENSNFIAAENFFNEGMKLAKQTDNYFQMGRLSNFLMQIYDKKGDMATAITYLKQGEQLLIKVNKKVNLTRLYCNASDVYVNHHLLEKATEYARKAYTTALESGDLEPVGTASFYIASRMQNAQKYDSAIYYFSQGLKIAEKLGVVYTQGDMLRGLSDVYSDIKEYNIARDYLKKAVAKYDSVNVTDRVIVCEESLAYLDFMNKDFNKVKQYILIREKKVTEDSLANRRYINKWRANLALIDNNVEDWKKYYRKYEQAEAVFANEKIQKSILELEAKYNFAKKESQLLQKDTENRKRLWIIAALSLGLVSIIVIAVMQYRNYKNKQKIAIQKAIIEKQQGISSERSRIAADMHDDMGSGLSRMRYLSTAMKNDVQDEGVKKELDKLIAGSDELIDKMNEIIWTLNSSDETLEDMLYYIRSQCSEMLDHANISFKYSLPNTIPYKMVSSEEKRNLYLVVKEAVHNAIKHAKADTVSLSVELTEKLKIIIADDGIGFDAVQNKIPGNGLGNYKKRMALLKGTVDIQSGKKGTIITFEVPV
jgi:two-component system, NarL family, sensor kinase